MDQRFTIEEIRNYLKGHKFTNEGNEWNYALLNAITELEDKNDGIFAVTMREMKQLELDIK